MKAFEQPNFRITGIAKEAITQYSPVVWQTDGTVKMAAAVSAIVCGIAQNPAKVGEEVTIMVQGVSFVKAGAAIGAGSQVSPSATAGKIGEFASGSTVIGLALTAASAADEIVSVLL